MHTTLSEAALLQALSAWQLEAPIQLTPIPGGFTSNVWFVDTPNQRYVAKYCYDSQAAFEDGLRASGVLASAGISCSAPIRTRTGNFSVMVEGPHGRSEPLALLCFVSGTPLDWTAVNAPQLAGQLLGRIHTHWQGARNFQPQDKISGYLAEEAPEVADQPGLQSLIDQAVANARLFEAETHVTYGPIIGDSIEILHDASTDSIGLIDCGAVGWGPLLFDLAIMLDMLPEAAQAEKQQFLQAYLATGPIQPNEPTGIRHYEALHWAQLAKYFAWRLAHNVTMGDDDPDGNIRSLAEIRAALEQLISNT